MIKATFNQLANKKGCITFPPADKDTMEETNKYMIENKRSDIPLDYRMLLNLSNGLIYNGVEFMGTKAHLREEKQYTFPSLIEINSFTTNYDFFCNKLILGRVSESVILYDKDINSYAVVDRVNLRSRMEVKNLIEIFEIFL